MRGAALLVALLAVLPGCGGGGIGFFMDIVALGYGEAEIPGPPPDAEVARSR